MSRLYGSEYYRKDVYPGEEIIQTEGLENPQETSDNHQLLNNRHPLCGITLRIEMEHQLVLCLFRSNHGHQISQLVMIIVAKAAPCDGNQCPARIVLPGIAGEMLHVNDLNLIS